MENEKASDISLTDVSKAAGHGDTAITERCYVHRNKKPVSKAFEVYERILVSWQKNWQNDSSQKRKAQKQLIQAISEPR